MAKTKSARPKPGKQPIWKRLLEAQLLPKIKSELLAATLRNQAIAMDYRNGIVRILAEPDSNHNERRLIEATAKSVIKLTPAKYHNVGVIVKQNLGFPYTVHVAFDKPAKLLSTLDSPIAVFTLSASEIRALRKALDDLATRVAKAPVVITFALGGVTALNYITHKLLSQMPGGSNGERLASIKALELKCHLFGGIGWRKVIV